MSTYKTDRFYYTPCMLWFIIFKRRMKCLDEKLINVFLSWSRNDSQTYMSLVSDDIKLKLKVKVKRKQQCLYRARGIQGLSQKKG